MFVAAPFPHVHPRQLTSMFTHLLLATTLLASSTAKGVFFEHHLSGGGDAPCSTVTLFALAPHLCPRLP
eukprot:gene8501-7770_t